MLCIKLAVLGFVSVLRQHQQAQCNLLGVIATHSTQHTNATDRRTVVLRIIYRMIIYLDLFYYDYLCQPVAPVCHSHKESDSEQYESGSHDDRQHFKEDQQAQTNALEYHVHAATLRHLLDLHH